MWGGGGEARCKRITGGAVEGFEHRCWDRHRSIGEMVSPVCPLMIFMTCCKKLGESVA